MLCALSLFSAEVNPRSSAGILLRKPECCEHRFCCQCCCSHDDGILVACYHAEYIFFYADLAPQRIINHHNESRWNWVTGGHGVMEPEVFRSQLVIDSSQGISTAWIRCLRCVACRVAKCCESSSCVGELFLGCSHLSPTVEKTKLLTPFGIITLVHKSHIHRPSATKE